MHSSLLGEHTSHLRLRFAFSRKWYRVVRPLTRSSFTAMLLRARDGASSPTCSLPNAQSLTTLLYSLLLSLLHFLSRLNQNHFHMARIAHVRVDSTVSPVRSPSLFRCLVDLNVLDNKVVGIQAFCVGIGFGVFEQVEEEGGRFDGVASSGDTEFFAC